MRKLLMKLKRDERGISALEYAVLAGILLIVIVLGIRQFSTPIGAIFDNTAAELDTIAQDIDGSATPPPGGGD